TDIPYGTEGAHCLTIWTAIGAALLLASENVIIKTDKVFEVMLATDRSHYTKCYAYMDSAQSIGFQELISLKS
uniref:Uncharacterized protein n=1 Tax=Oryctolagus cuniculus TaxID=9986 RepID=A0A5F9C6S2_RABIT